MIARESPSYLTLMVITPAAARPWPGRPGACSVVVTSPIAPNTATTPTTTMRLRTVMPVAGAVRDWIIGAPWRAVIKLVCEGAMTVSRLRDIPGIGVDQVGDA